MTRAAAGRHVRRGVSAGRVAAATILQEVDSGRRLDVAWEASGATRGPERAWIRNLVYGTVRLRGRIDHLLARFLSQSPTALDPVVIAALRMGAYQLLEMRAVPVYAAVNEAVEQVKRTRSRAATGLVNAVLRKIARSGCNRAFFPDREADLEGYLTAWGSHPRWLVRRWIAAFGPEGAEGMVEANNREPAVYLRPLGTPAEAQQALARARLCEPDSAGASWIRLAPRVDPRSALAVVPGVIQDPAASLVVDYASPGPRALVADLCAAPGGKALALTGSARRVLAADLSERRLARVVEGERRLNAGVAAGRLRRSGRTWVVAADARRPPLRSADVVLADVPCSGTGTLRRHPDGKWRIGETDVRTLVGVQRAILEGAASMVPRGGILVYATCALEYEENWGQVENFLQRHPGFRMEPGNVPDRFVDANGCLSVLPHESGFDGAFSARMRKVGAD